MHKGRIKLSIVLLTIVSIMSVTANAYSLIIGIKDNKVAEILDNDAKITWAEYPEIDIFKQITDETEVKIGDLDPSIENPSIIEGTSDINLPVIFAEIRLDKTQLCINCREDEIKFSIRLVLKKEEEWITIPFSSDFFIPLRHLTSNTLDVFKVILDKGQAEIVYPSIEELKMGVWGLNEADLSFIYLPKDLEQLEDITKVFEEIAQDPEKHPMKAYRIKLLNPVVFMAYRKL